MKNVFATIALVAMSLVGSTALANPTGGQKVDHDVLRPGASVTYYVNLNANELTAATVIGDGDGDIDCVLFDNNGNIVDSASDVSDSCYLTVMPRWTGLFQLVVKNNGIYSSMYDLRIW